MTDLPYQAEYAKTGRASCKGCKQKIEQGALRLAIMVQSAFFDGKQPNWHHEDCFFNKQRPTSFSDIGNFNKLKSEDQKRIKATLENHTGIVLPAETKGKGKGAKKRAASDAGTASALKDFKIEYAKSSRATCKHCELKICKDDVRIAKVVYDTEIGSKFGGQPLWHHIQCFADNRMELLYFAGGGDLPGFNSLSKEDKAMVKKEIVPFKPDDVPVKKLKAEPKDADELKEEKHKQKKMEKQNKLFDKHRAALADVGKVNLAQLLKDNSQEVPGRTDECLDRVADCMAFGALEPCPECKGQLVLDTFGYKCTGNISEYTKCCYVTQGPKRVPMKVTKGFLGSIFAKFKPKTDVRLFEAAPRPVVLVKTEAAMSIKKDIPIPPLKNLQFFLYGKMKNKEETKKRILRLGGLVVTKLTDTLAAVVSSAKEVEKMSEKMEDIKIHDVEVVEESFFDLIDKDTGTIHKSMELIKDHNIADWGSDPATRVPQDVLDGKSVPKSGSMYVKSTKSGVQKIKIQGGTAVDPASKLQDEAHVYKDGAGTKYTVVLSQTDVVAQKNSFYKMQVLESDDRRKYYLFRAWGRIGTSIGGDKVEICRSADEAVGKFEDLYLEKTENRWWCRDNFKKIPGRYQPLDLDYGDDETKTEQLELDEACELPVPVQKLIMKIFDVNTMKKTLLEFELDTEKMPLGKLSKKQIKTGYKVLSELLEYIEKGAGSQSKIVDATNRFFTLIPHDFGVNNAPLLNDVELVRTKTAMLDNLLEIEIAYSLMKTESNESSPISAHYLKLKAEIAPLHAASPEYEIIKEYLQNTHAATHSGYTLEIEEVFKVVRSGEEKRYKPFRKLHNRRLLWHGSRVTNFAGIISQGLRIAPPEAPVTGYMFGKGVYFADMVSKSANYCCTNVRNPVGLALLCEVALGNMKECLHAENVTLPPNTHSAWGVGRTQPDPAQNRTLDDGTVVPLGKPVTSKVNSSLLYNEFIVYDVAQVNVKYLLQLKFNYNY